MTIDRCVCGRTSWKRKRVIVMTTSHPSRFSSQRHFLNSILQSSIEPMLISLANTLKVHINVSCSARPLRRWRHKRPQHRTRQRDPHTVLSIPMRHSHRNHHECPSYRKWYKSVPIVPISRVYWPLLLLLCWSFVARTNVGRSVADCFFFSDRHLNMLMLFL